MKYDTPKQHLRRLRFERLVTYLKYLGISILGGLTLWVLLAIMPDDTFIDRFNGCLQDHSLNYCNKTIK